MFEWKTQTRNESEGELGSLRWEACPSGRAALSADQDPLCGDRFELEPSRDDPIGDELWLCRLKTRETSLEGRRGSDVQIDPQMWL